VNRVITMEELKAQSGPEEPWFVVGGEGGVIGIWSVLIAK